jgi:hypothetical protein
MTRLARPFGFVLSALLPTFSGVSGCKSEKAPQSMTLEVAEPVFSSDPAAVVIKAREQDGTIGTRSGEHEFSVSPEGIASVNKRGLLTCEKSGDVTVNAAIGAVKSSTKVRCRLVERLESKDLGRVELANGPFEPPVRVLDKAGNELGDVPIELNSTTPLVLAVESGKLVPKAVGHASVIARVGQKRVDLKIDLVRKLEPEALPLHDNKTIHFSLDMGRFELTIKLPQPKKLKMEWVGAPYCNYVGQSDVHQATCALRMKGGVNFDNPAYILSGSTEVSRNGIEIYEIPP